MASRRKRSSPEDKPETPPLAGAQPEVGPGETAKPGPAEKAAPSTDECPPGVAALRADEPNPATSPEPAAAPARQPPGAPEEGSAAKEEHPAALTFPAISPGQAERLSALIASPAKPESARNPNPAPGDPPSAAILKPGVGTLSPAKEAELPPPMPKFPPSAIPKLPLEEELVRELPELEPAVAESKEPQEPVTRTPPSQPSVPRLFVMMLTAELAPVAKVGGLADVVYGLSHELERRGHAVEIVLPKYDCMRYDLIRDFQRAYERLQVPWFNGAIPTTVWQGAVNGLKCFFIEPHSPDNFFNRGNFYGSHDDVLRFAFFCRAALEFMFKAGKHPEILHCHDWQTALAPVLLYETYAHLGMRHSRVCLTIHNFRHQGTTGDLVLRATGLHRPEHFFHYDRLRDNQNPRALSLLKGGIVYSNFVNTVSPRHAWEAKDGGQGHGLEPTLHIHHYKFGGVLNGVDYDAFNPETDPCIPHHYNAQSIERKYDNKRALRRRLWLAESEKPIVGFVGRLDPQKGLELVRHGIFYSLQQRAQFVLLGQSPDRSINDHFWGLKRHLNENPDCHLEIGYQAELANLIYAGADLLLVPSRFEPCGLTQLIAMRYGTVPVVHAVGGLADTVFDKDYSDRPPHQRNGYVFHNADNPGVESALGRAIACYYQYPEDFRQLILHGMKCDFSWNQPAQDYLKIYDFVRDK
jgi:starch synthase